MQRKGNIEKNNLTKVLYMSFDKFLLAVESRDLSQADKSIIRVSSFPKLFLNDKIYSSAIHHTALEKKTLLYYFCQLEIDHVTQQPKETCQRTCRGP